MSLKITITAARTDQATVGGGVTFTVTAARTDQATVGGGVTFVAAFFLALWLGITRASDAAVSFL